MPEQSHKRKHDGEAPSGVDDTKRRNVEVMNNRWWPTCVVFLVLIFVRCVSAQNPTTSEQIPSRQENRAVVMKVYRENLATYEGHADVLVKPGLLANRKKHTVIVFGEATGLEAGEILEYFLIDETSGKAYESLAVSFVKPSDIHEALIFIGMQPGRSVDPRILNFWPKGERVMVSVKTSKVGPIPFETFMIDHGTGEPLRPMGFVFTGSIRAPSQTDPHKEIYVADAREPNSIISNYNEPQTVLDVPRLASKQSGYGSQRVNPEWVLAKGELLEIIMRPEFTNGKKRVKDVLVEVRWTDDADIKPEKEGKDNNSPFQVKFLDEVLKIDDVVKKLRTLVKEGYDPYVTLKFDDRMTLKAAGTFCSLMMILEGEGGIRLEAPLPGSLYHRAFFPREEDRARDKRTNQPWELHLGLRQGHLTGKLIEINQMWKKGKVYPDLETSEYQIETPRDVKDELSEHGPGLPVIFVYAPFSMTYGQLMSFIRPVHKEYPTIYVFQPQPE